jgi:monofunctional chorismate mutase
MFRGFFTFGAIAMNLDEQRNKIDEIDTKIIGLLRQRASLSRKIGAIKSAAGLPIVDPDREDAVIRRLLAESKGELSRESIMRIYGEILAESQRIQLGIASDSKLIRETV